MVRKSRSLILLATISLGAVLACSQVALYVPTATVAPTPTLIPTDVPTTAPTLAPTDIAATDAPTEAPETNAVGAYDDYYPGLGNSGYDVQHYTLDMDVNVDANHIDDAVVTIDAIATQNLRVFNLDFSGPEISSLTVDGADATFTRQDYELIITPANPISDSQPFTVVVRYSGTPKSLVPEAVSLDTGWVVFDGGILTMGEPAGAHTWYPVNDHPMDKATYTYIITVPKPYVVAANGLEKSEQDNGGTTTYTWEASDPLASYLVTIQMGKFIVDTSQGPDGLPIRSYYPAEIAPDAREDFASIPDMIDFFSSIFGPYPFEAYGVVVADTDLGYALESQTLTLMGRNIVAAPFSIESTSAHELSHQWFGDSVTPKQWHDIWLNEGFATYAALLWSEHKDGEDLFQRQIKDLYDNLPTSTGPDGPVGRPPKDDLFNGEVYSRGAMTLHALRLKVGDETFFKIMRTYADRYKYSNAGTQDFIAVAEEVSRQQLDDLFDAWLYQSKKPPMPE